jgi:predicted small lipoprotein YifL
LLETLLLIALCCCQILFEKRIIMFSSHFFARKRRTPMLALVLAVALAGCGSKQDKAIDQAKKQAAATGQPQQVVSVDKTGTTTTTVVQPPAKGQSAEAVTTTIAPPLPGAPVPPPQDPKVSPLGGDQNQGQGPAQAQAQGSGPAGSDGGKTSPSGPPATVKVTIQAGTTLAIRIDQRISVKHSHPGDTFTGEVVESVVDPNGNAIVPKGTRVGGVVDEAHKRGHFKAASVLELRLTSMTLDGAQYHLRTADLTERKKGKGKRSAAMIGGGAGLGMLIGGIATGGTGLLIGGLAGGGAGAAGAGLTGNRDLDIPAETVVHFKLAQDLVVQGE